MPPISQPSGQVRLTNIAIVRYKREGKRFEIACYKNKVVNWRSRVETNVNEVLQAQQVFTNVSRGVVASKADLLAAFGTGDHLACCIAILERGELEVSDKERQMQYDTLFRDVAATVADKCVNPETMRAYPVSIVERALHEAHFALVPTKSAKAQAPKAILALRAVIPIERARMRVRVCAFLVAPPDAEGGGAAAGDAGGDAGAEVAGAGTGAGADSGVGLGQGVAAELKAWLSSMGASIESEARVPGTALASAPAPEAGGDAPQEGRSGERVAVEAVVDPGLFRRIEDESRRLFPGSSVEVVSLSVVADAAASGGGSGNGGSGVGMGLGRSLGAQAQQQPALARGGPEADSADGGDEEDEEGAADGLASALAGGAIVSPPASAPVSSSSSSSLSSQPAPVPAPATSVSAASAHSHSQSHSLLLAEATAASARGTGMAVRRVTQPGQRGLACNACAAEFATADEHRAHHRSDWHRLNLKRKVRALAPLGLDAFDAMPAKERAAFLDSDL